MNASSAANLAIGPPTAQMRGLEAAVVKRRAGLAITATPRCQYRKDLAVAMVLWARMGYSERLVIRVLVS